MRWTHPHEHDLHRARRTVHAPVPGRQMVSDHKQRFLTPFSVFFCPNDKNAVVGMSNINPLLQKKAKVKPLKLPKAKLGVAGATPKPFKPTLPAMTF